MTWSCLITNSPLLAAFVKHEAHMTEFKLQTNTFYLFSFDSMFPFWGKDCISVFYLAILSWSGISAVQIFLLLFLRWGSCSFTWLLPPSSWKTTTTQKYSVMLPVKLWYHCHYVEFYSCYGRRCCFSRSLFYFTPTFGSCL